MKRLYILFFLIACLYGCKEAPQTVIIQGEIKGIATDTLILYGSDELSDFVTEIYIENGLFQHEMPIDTLLQSMLVLPNRQIYPIYLDKGNKIEVKGDINTSNYLEVSGNTPNEELTAFYKEVQLTGVPTDSIIQAKAEEFIYSHPTSLVSVFLLDKYFFQTGNIRVDRFKSLTTMMDGELQDKPLIGRISSYLEEVEKTLESKLAPGFNLTDSQNNTVSKTDSRNKILLINFWASWCDSCQASNVELKKIYKELIKPELDKKKKKKTRKDEKDESKFAMLGVSLDFDKTEWLKAIEKDTLKWQQTIDQSGWDSKIVKEYSIPHLPYSILIGADGKIVARNMTGEELIKKIKELKEKEIEKEKEKERKEKEKKKKK